MTDKQIIIDVCPYQGECSVSGCKRNDDGCFVRQLFEERYRAENQIVELNKTIQAKEQECEELKGISMKKCPKCGEVYLNSVGMEAFNQLDQLKAQLLDQEAETLKAGEIIHNLKQTLTEIKEIAKNGCYDDCGMPLDELSIILQKISEVEDG